jgi:hypothetical protein
MKPSIQNNREKHIGTALGLANQTGYESNMVGLQNITYSNFTQLGKTNTNVHSQMSHSKKDKKKYKQSDEFNFNQNHV